MDSQVLKICEAVREAGGRAMLVGGWVRDHLLGIESKDFDIEAYRIEPARLRNVLESLGKVNTVGEHFAVYKLAFYRPNRRPESQISNLKSESEDRFEIDVSIPRRESKSGQGHRGFVIEGDPMMSFEEAARRRDFTVNAILFDPLALEYVDPYNGIEDLNRRVLRVVAADTFVEDSLRVLRGAQLAARFEMTIDPATIELCREVNLSDLPRERIWGEIEKLLMLARKPSIGFQAALELGVLDKLFPEIGALTSRPQPNECGAEGDLFTHTKLSLDEAAMLSRDLPKEKRITVMLATLCHALGDAARATLDTLGIQTISSYDVRTQVLALTSEHQKPVRLFKDRERASDGAFRRLSIKVELDLLYRVAKACAAGCDSISGVEAADWFIERARQLGVEHHAPAPLLKGRHLIAAGFEPGPRIGEILRHVYELQLDGKLTTLEEALAAAENYGRDA